MESSGLHPAYADLVAALPHSRTRFGASATVASKLFYQETILSQSSVVEHRTCCHDIPIGNRRSPRRRHRDSQCSVSMSLSTGEARIPSAPDAVSVSPGPVIM
ncbi:hypothetical protein F1559_000971 [Cyanidiococcus yangmingshanensis]|uniref:Uncharacterized protein n=1 Tax=Cyanidiococcus yangmingshanensis TaxID=2690220 RepID=A0A7J7IMU2_9RHOD|nr:hypothetical protein F1559_000971 [Cyanidiococcus yangmingshanensis]